VPAPESHTSKRRAPSGDLSTYARAPFEAAGFRHDVYRKGEGPAVIVITEIPNISPMVVGFADRLVAMGFTAVLPDLYGEAGRDPFAGGPLAAVRYMRTIGTVCISREFTVLATGRASPVIAFLRVLATEEHARCGGPGVGVIGMCFAGGFALAMAAEPSVIAPVLSQPSTPFGLTAAQRGSIDCSDADLTRVAGRCAREGLEVLGLRFESDRLSPPERFAFLRERLGDAFVSIELPASAQHPDSPLAPHSVLTHDLIDEPGEPTREALDAVLALFERKLRPLSARG
jgi:dienelactone hydrolase